MRVSFLRNDRGILKDDLCLYYHLKYTFFEQLPLYTELGMVSANVVARAIARGVYTATALPFPGALPGCKDLFG